MNSDNTFGLKVEKAVIDSPRLEGNERVQYLITEDGLPLYQVNRWLETMSWNSYLTGKSYAYNFVDFLRFIKSRNMHYRDVTSKSFIEDYIKYLVYGDNLVTNMVGKVSFNSIKQRISIVKGFYEWLEDQGDIEHNPVLSGVKKNSKNKKPLKSKFLYGQIWEFDIEHSIAKKLKLKRKQEHVKWYKEVEIHSILEHLPSSRDQIIFKISIETGMRIGEIIGLHLEHFDSFENILMVRKNDNYENEGLAKTSERDLYISEQLATELSYYIQGERSEVDCHSSNYLFLNHKGKTKGAPLKSRNYLKILKNAAEKVGIDSKNIRTHSGRSTHAQFLLEALHKGEITEGYILQQMGWNNISTLKTYTHSFNEKNRISLSKEIVEKQIKLPSINKGE